MPSAIKIEGYKPGTGGEGSFSQVLEKSEVTIGRAAGNDIILQEPQVSSRHARLTIRPEGDGGEEEIFITDVGSSNGTYLEEKRLVKNVETKLPPGSKLLIGGFLISATLVKDSPPEKVAKSEKQKGEKQKSESPDKSKKEKSSLFEEEIRLKRLIHDQLIDRLDLRRKDILAISEGELRERAKGVVEQILVSLRWEIPEGLNREKLIRQVLDEALALGPLEELLAEDGCSEIMVNSFDMIYAERSGQLKLTEHRFSSEQAVLASIERILAPIGRRIDESSPMVDARLKDGSRVNAVIRPLALRGPCITIRKFSKKPLTAADLVKFGSFSKGISDFLKLAVESRLNVVISGGTGSGKTTLLNVIASFIPDGERVITVEDAAELQLPQEHLVAFETRPPNLEGKGAIAIRDLVKNALRMRPDRIIVGECRGAEALDMLQAMNTGHDGSMTTGHSNSPQDMVSRLETMVLMAGLDLPVRAVREQIASAVDIIVQQTRFSCGTRRVTAVSEVIGMDRDEGTVTLQDVFLFRQDGYGADGKVRGYHQATGYIPQFFRKLQERGLPVNAEVFSPDKKP